MRVVFRQHAAECFLLCFLHQCRQLLSIDETFLALFVEPGFKQEAGVDIHKESYTVLNFRFQQSQLLIFIGSSLHLRVRYDYFSKG
ncbi:hypothetical protein D3C76_1507730 [compost metagenome]